MKRRPTSGYIAWILVCVLWGWTYTAIRVGVESMPPLLFAGVRFVPAGLLMIAWRRAVGVSWPKGREWLHLSIPGILLLFFGNGLLVYSEQFVPGGIASLVIAVTPLWMVSLAFLLPRGQSLTLLECVGLLLGFSGLLVLIWPEIINFSGVGEYLHGILLLLVATVAWGIGSVYISRHPTHSGPLMGAGIQMLLAGVLHIVTGLSVGELADFHMTAAGGWALLYLIIGGSIGGYGGYVYALQHLPLGLVSTYAYVNPIIALATGALLLGEVVDARTMVSTVIILTGVILVNRNLWPKRWRPLEG